jgi:two-component system, chemotaxis family, protein-glutamate methylesterase/glutaminase
MNIAEPLPTLGRAVVIGGSAGALEALSQILPVLPADFPWPVFVVVHLPPHSESLLAEVLQNKCSLKVREAEDKEPFVPGTVYFAPPDYHLLIEAGGYFSLSADEPELFSRPSIDVLFESAADVYGPDLVGIILSGANQDGSRGLLAIADEGGQTIVQDPATAYAKMMPTQALQSCPHSPALSAEEIARYLVKESRHV